MSDDHKIEMSRCWTKLFSIEQRIIDLTNFVSNLDSRLDILEKLPLRSYTKEECDSIFMSKMQGEQMERDLDRGRTAR